MGTPLAEALADAGYTVSVVNPAMIEAYARSRLTRTKTDRTDARLIAQFCATQQPHRGYRCRARYGPFKRSCAAWTPSRGCGPRSGIGSPRSQPTR